MGLPDHPESRLARFLFRRPCTVFLLTFIAVFISIGTTFGAGLFEFNTDSERDFQYAGSTAARTEQAYQVAQKAVLVGQTQSERSIEFQRGRLTLVYLARGGSDGNVLTSANIALMHSIENMVTNTSKWPELCFAGSAFNGCSAPASLVSYVYAQHNASNGALTANATADFLSGALDATGRNASQYGNLTDILVALNSAALEQRDSTSYFFGNGFDTTLRAGAVRARIDVGVPLQGFASEQDREKDQEDIVDNYMKEFRSALDDASTDDVEVLYSNAAISNEIVTELVQRDFAFVVGSITVVFLYMAFHTRSFFLAGLGIVNVLCAFPLAYFFYRVIFQVTYFSFMQVLVIFLILGIGADDVFIYVDTWKLSGQMYGTTEEVDLARAQFTFNVASRSMFSTTLTTMVAFSATALSEIPSISAFGVYALLVVGLNYLLVITFFPAALSVFHHRERRIARGLARPTCCLVPVGRKKVSEIAPSGTDSSNVYPTEHDVEMASLERGDSPAVKPSGDRSTASPTRSHESKGAHANGNGTTVAFHAGADTVKERGSGDADPAPPTDYTRGISMGYSIEPRKMEVFFRDTFTPFLHTKGKFVIAFGAVLLILGAVFTAQLRPPTEVETVLPSDSVIIKFDDAMRDDFPASPLADMTEVHIFWGVDGEDRSGLSFWDFDEDGTIVWDTAFDLSLPSSQSTVLNVCGNASALTERVFSVACFMEGFKSYVEGKSITFPMTNATQFYEELYAFSQLDTTVRDYPNQIGFDASRVLRYAAVKVLTKTRSIVSVPENRDRLDFWTAFVAEQNAMSPAAAQMKQSTFQAWSWVETNEYILSSTVLSIAVSMALAYAVLIFVTGNWIIASLATVCIVGIVVDVLGCAWLLGWSFSFVEALVAIVLIGYSVDFVVHLGHRYTECAFDDRVKRVETAATQLGISIVAGAITTFGSSLFLFFAKITFFVKFATVMALTIAFSLTWSLAIFLSLCITYGPEGSKGSVEPLIQKCKSCFRRGHREE